MVDAQPARPLVSVGIPLYRSLRFLDIIIENIEMIEYENVEIIVSDQYMLDDTLDILRQRYGSDSRFSFLSRNGEPDWVENHNLVLRRSTGKYFLCMAHDDSFPPNYIGELVSALEQQPDAVLAFGRVEQLSMDGFLPTFPFTPPPFSSNRDWSFWCALRALTLWQLWVAFRGLVRREVVEQSNLYIRHTYRNIRADIYWLFGLSMKGRLCFVPSCYYIKRFHESSGGAGWRYGIHQSLDACRVLQSYLDDFSHTRLEKLTCQTVIFPWCLAQGFLPGKLAKKLGILTRRVLLGPNQRQAEVETQ